MIASAYIHIPFCKKICSYCDFTKFCYQKKWIKPYLDSLKEEIKINYNNELLKTIYIGGGTPTSLDAEELEYLLKITNILKKDSDIEFTMEANLDDLIPSKIKLLKKYGVNRISIGIQTFNKNLQKILNRVEDYNKLKEALNLLKENNISNINLDLMYALPNETLEDLEKDLDLMLSLEIKHISTYSLILEPNTILSINNIKPIEEDLDLKMYNIICNKLKENGYNHYEVSNFSKKGFESKHNLTYWNNEKYYGFGLGASGYIKNYRYTNHQNLNKYLKKDFTKEIEKIDNKKELEYEMILGLRKLEGVSNKKFKEKYDKNIIDVFKLNKLIEEKYLIFKNDYLKIPEEKIFLSNEVLINFLIDD